MEDVVYDTLEVVSREFVTLYPTYDRLSISVQSKTIFFLLRF
jgi:hypothetical protein